MFGRPNTFGETTRYDLFDSDGNQDGDWLKLERLPLEEFLGRFLQHVLPRGFVRVPHDGLLANCVMQPRLHPRFPPGQVNIFMEFNVFFSGRNRRLN